MYKNPGTGGLVGGAGLAATGANLTWWLAFGIALLVAGLFLVRASRCRGLVAAGPAGGSMLGRPILKRSAPKSSAPRNSAPKHSMPKRSVRGRSG